MANNHDEDDKPTVVLDLNKLKKEQESKEASLAEMAAELEFNVLSSKPAAPAVERFPVILFDFNDDFFASAKTEFPKGIEYIVCTALGDLSAHLKNKKFQIVVFLYDQNPKGVNQLTAQIKQKFPHTKVVILAKKISPEKMKLHAASPSGAHGYLTLPLETKKIEQEFRAIQKQEKKAG